MFVYVVKLLNFIYYTNIWYISLDRSNNAKKCPALPGNTVGRQYNSKIKMHVIMFFNLKTLLDLNYLSHYIISD